MRAILNPAIRRDEHFRGLFGEQDYDDVRAYYAAHPEFPPTPLLSFRSMAAAIGVAAIDVKDETRRFGVNAFKIVGVRYAVHRLGDEAARGGLVCATAGNHGRAVARVAGEKHVPCTIFLPAARTSDPVEARTRAARVAAMQADGATVVEVNGTYEAAVDRAAAFGRATGAAIVSDTSWDGYEQVPRWIMAGYTRLFDEAATQWDAPPDVVFVQGGVGGLVCAAASWFAWRFGSRRPYLIACEPEHAACLLESAAAGRPVTVTSSLDTIMAGLRCASPSPVAWPAIAQGIDAFVSIPDAPVLDTMQWLAAMPDAERIDAGPSGACGLAALRVLMGHDELDGVRRAARLDRSARVLAIVTEGA